MTDDTTTNPAAPTETPARFREQIEMLTRLWINGLASGYASALTNHAHRDPATAEEIAQSVVERLVDSDEGREHVLQAVGDTIAGVTGERVGFWLPAATSTEAAADVAGRGVGVDR